MVNYTFVWPSAKANAPEIVDVHRLGPLPVVVEGQPSRVTIGGVNLGVGADTEHPEQAFEAAACLASADNQVYAATEGGLPPTIIDLYDDPAGGEVLPVRGPAEGDAGGRGAAGPDALVQRRLPRHRPGPLHPLRRSTPKTTYDDLVDAVQRALDGEGLL